MPTAIGLNAETRNYIWTMLGLILLCVIAARVVSNKLKGKARDKVKLVDYISSKNSLVGFLIGESVIIFGTLFGYIPSGREAFFDYFAFAFPCLAGIAAGVGLLDGANVVESPLKNTAFRWYFGSVILLALAYLGYLVKAKTQGPFAAAILSMSLACLIALTFRTRAKSAKDIDIVDAVAAPLIVTFLWLLLAVVVISAIKKFAS